MKKIALIISISSLAISSLATELKTDDQKISYAIGHKIGKSLQVVKDAVVLDKKALFEAISNSIENKEIKLSKEEINNSMKILQNKIRVKVENDNKIEGEKYLLGNKTKKGVKVTKSGLQYRVIKPAKNDKIKPKETDIVKVNYKGFFPDGTKFDDSSDAGGAVEFPLNKVIPGWTEAIQLMPVGATYEFVIPSKLAYGSVNPPPSIGPNRVLRFEVELIEIVKNPKKETKKNKENKQDSKK